MSRWKHPTNSTWQIARVLYKDRDDKFVCLMDLAVLAMKKLRREGKLEDLEESDEINACSIVVPVDHRRQGQRSGS